jgi:hypothetical protein
MFSAAGTALGSNFGPVGAMIGGKAGQLLSHITGFGDYELEGNTIMTGGLTPPQIVNSVNHGGSIVRHREYLGDIYGNTSSFSSTTFPINPGSFSTFPWLSQVALAYEEYEFRGLIFEFKSLSSDAVLSGTASSALGYVAMATQYNASSLPFSDKKALENYEYSNSNKPSISFIHPIECKRSLNVDTHLYIRSGAIPAGQDPKFYDLGVLNVAVGGMQNSGTAIIGELWATYEVELYHPKYTINAGALTDHFTGTGVTATSPLGNARTPSAGNNLGITFLTNNEILFPPSYSDGEYLFNFCWVGTNSVAIGFPTCTYINCFAVTAFTNNTNYVLLSPAPATTANSMQFTQLVRILGPNATIQMNGAGVFPTGAATCDITIAESASLV